MASDLQKRGTKILKIPSTSIPHMCILTTTPHPGHTAQRHVHRRSQTRSTSTTERYRVCFPNKGFAYGTVTQWSRCGTRPHRLICGCHSGFPRGPGRLTPLRGGEAPSSPTHLPAFSAPPGTVLLLSLGPLLMSYFRIRSNTEDRKCCEQAPLSGIHFCITQYSKAWPLSRPDTAVNHH